MSLAPHDTFKFLILLVKLVFFESVWNCDFFSLIFFLDNHLGSIYDGVVGCRLSTQEISYMNHLSFEKEFVPEIPLLLVHQITRFLTDAIIEGQLKGGQRLVENELQRKFKVSRAPIRESFRILEKKGLVVIIPHRGTFVRTIDQKKIEENFAIRAYLEAYAAGSATGQLSDEDTRNLESAFSEIAQAIETENFLNYIKAHYEFHKAFIKASRNDTLIGIIENIAILPLWYKFMLSYVRENYEYCVKVHGEILYLFQKREAAKVEALVKEHILKALGWFLEFLAARDGKELGMQV
jgi:DNA-binding GntR family transcriptional regulator